MHYNAHMRQLHDIDKVEAQAKWEDAKLDDDQTKSMQNGVQCVFVKMPTAMLNDKGVCSKRALSTSALTLDEEPALIRATTRLRTLARKDSLPRALQDCMTEGPAGSVPRRVVAEDSDDENERGSLRTSFFRLRIRRG